MSHWVGIEQLELSPHRPEKGIPRVSSQLLTQVRAHGPLDPVVVRPCGPERYEILSNAETWLAVQRVGQHQVPIEVRDDIDDAETAELLELAAHKGQPNPIAEAEAVLQRIEELGGRKKRGAIAQTAREEGRSRSYVSHALRLLTLPNLVQDMLASGVLSAGHARALVSLPDRRRQIRLAHRVQRDALSVRQLEDLVYGRGTKAPAKVASTERSQTPSEDPDIRRLELQVSELLGCPTFVDTEQGELVIRYMQDLEVLEGVLDRLGYAGH